MHKPFRLNIPISKIDEEQRMVYGVATSEMLDHQGDIVDYEASKAAFSNWLGNIREMHQPVAVGKAIDIQFDDENKQVIIGAKISESADGENAWIKIKEGVLNGYSIGGDIHRVKKEVAKNASGDEVAARRVVEYSLAETSLVDSPANPEALFVMVKSIDGNLQRVEAMEKTAAPHPVAWWQQQFMLPIEKAQSLYDQSMKKGDQMKKGMWDASFLLDLAIELGYYINGEEYEGESVDDLKSALETIKQAVVKELNEPTPELTTAVALAEKVSNLKKGKNVEKTNVVGGEERNATAEVTQTREEAGRPVNDTEERAADAGVTPAVEGNDHVYSDETKTPDQPQEGKTTAGAEADKAGKAKEDPKGKPSTSADESEKAVTVGDLKKFSEGLIQKLGESSEGKLEKTLGEFTDKVDSLIKGLEGRIKKLEDQPAVPKAKASFATITKGDEGQDAEEADVQALVKRRDELAANPNLGTSEERFELAGKLRKAQAAGHKLT